MNRTDVAQLVRDSATRFGDRNPQQLRQLTDRLSKAASAEVAQGLLDVFASSESPPRGSPAQELAGKLLAVTENRTGMIAGITGAISDMKTGIRDARASVAPDERGHIEVTVEVFDVKHLDKVINSIKGVPGVIDVERMQGMA